MGFVESQAGAAAVVDRHGRLVAANAAFLTTFALASPSGAALSDLFASTDDEARFQTIARTGRNRPGGKTIVSVALPDSDRPTALLVGHQTNLSGYRPEAPLLGAVLIQPQWTQELGTLLSDAFHLTAAEIETLELFMDCGSVQGIAERRGRSVRTVRTQLSRVFAQIGVSGQTELALFLAALSQLQPADRDLSPTAPVARHGSPDAITHRVVSTAAGPLEVLEYGAPDGRPVLLLQSTHPPQMTAPLRHHLRAVGLRMIAPLKPGSGRSVQLGSDAGPDVLAPLYRDVMVAVGVERAVIAWQASGGLYALSFAKRWPGMTQAVALLDTGVPFASKRELLRLPSGIRRTMLPARYFPDMLFLPHRLVADTFAQSAKGEAKVVDYFFEGSPEDQALTRTDRAFYDITRDIIAHSFEDTDRLVRDVSRWASDWRADLSDVAAQGRVRFIHGAGNTMFDIAKIEQALAAGMPHADLVTLAGGQLAAYQSPDQVAKAIAALW